MLSAALGTSVMNIGIKPAFDSVQIPEAIAFDSNP